MTERFLKIAVAHQSVAADVRDNGRSLRQAMREAAAAGARLVHFAEGALSGYAKSQITSRDWSAFDWPVLRHELEATAALAKELGIWVAIGSAHRLSPPHRPHNSLYIVSDRGEVVDRYDKRLLSNTEITDWYTPGFEPTVLEVDGIRLGCAICIEVQFAEVFDEYRRLGVDGVLLSVYPPDDDPMFQITARAHASLNNVWISFAVPASIGGRLASCIIGPDGHLQAEARGASHGVACADIRPDHPRWEVPLRRARPWRETARAGAIYRECRVDDPRSANKTAL